MYLKKHPNPREQVLWFCEISMPAKLPIAAADCYQLSCPLQAAIERHLEHRFAALLLESHMQTGRVSRAMLRDLGATSKDT